MVLKLFHHMPTHPRVDQIPSQGHTLSICISEKILTISTEQLQVTQTFSFFLSFFPDVVWVLALEVLHVLYEKSSILLGLAL